KIPFPLAMITSSSPVRTPTGAGPGTSIPLAIRTRNAPHEGGVVCDSPHRLRHQLVRAHARLVVVDHGRDHDLVRAGLADHRLDPLPHPLRRADDRELALLRSEEHTSELQSRE